MSSLTFQRVIKRGCIHWAVLRSDTVETSCRNFTRFIMSTLLCANRVTVEAIGEDEAAVGVLETSLLAWASDWATDVVPGKNVTIDASATT